MGMFFVKDLTHELTLHPQYFSRELSKTLLDTLILQVSGTCTDKHGYVVSVVSIESCESEHGLLLPGESGKFVF